MDQRRSFFLIFVILSLSKACFAETNNDVLHYSANGFEQQQLIQLDSLVVTPDYLNLNNQISFAAPVGAQHPNQKPQPEPRPPPQPFLQLDRRYHDYEIYIDDGITRSYVYYQRKFD